MMLSLHVTHYYKKVSKQKSKNNNLFSITIIIFLTSSGSGSGIGAGFLVFKLPGLGAWGRRGGGGQGTFKEKKQQPQNLGS